MHSQLIQSSRDEKMAPTRGVACGGRPQSILQRKTLYKKLLALARGNGEKPGVLQIIHDYTGGSETRMKKDRGISRGPVPEILSAPALAVWTRLKPARMAGGSPPRRFSASNIQRSSKGAGRPANHAVRWASRLRNVGLKEPITHRAGKSPGYSSSSSKIRSINSW